MNQIDQDKIFTSLNISIFKNLNLYNKDNLFDIYVDNFYILHTYLNLFI